MEVNRDVTRRDILYGVLKRMDEVIDSISNTVSTKDFLVRDIIYDLDRLEEAKLAVSLTQIGGRTGFGSVSRQRSGKLRN